MKLSDLIIGRNRDQSRLYCDPSERVRRATYRQQHPTEIIAFKCMDGRLDLPRITRTPQGSIQPFRNVGGNFNLGWPFLGEVVRQWVDDTITHGRNRLVIATYHFSKSTPHWGCKGQDYDMGRGVAVAKRLRDQFESVFGTQYRSTHPIVLGVETDEDALIFHAEGDHETYAVAEHTSDSPQEVAGALRRLYPSMLRQTLDDLLPLVIGNQAHVSDIRRSDRKPIELDHAERVIAVGRGFDWLHMPNTALIIGPYDHRWPDAVETAGRIVLNNLETKRIPLEEGALLLISALSHDPIGSFGWNLAIQKTHYLERVALQTLEDRVPELIPTLRHCKGVLEADTRYLHLTD